MSARSYDALRRSLLGMFVADLSLLLSICALIFQQPWTRLGAVLGAVAIPWIVFVLTRSPIARLAFAEWRAHRSRSFSAFIGVAFGTAALCMAIGLLPTHQSTERLVAAAKGGPADLIVEAPSEVAQIAAREAIDSVRANPDLQLLFDAEPLELKWASAWIDTGTTHRVRVISLDPKSAVLFGGARKEAGLSAAKDGEGVTLSERTASQLGVRVGQTINVLTSTNRQSIEAVVVHQILPDRGLIGLPDADGLPVSTLFVDPGSFVRLRNAGWSDPVRYWSVISLCGTPDSKGPKSTSGQDPTAPSPDSSTRFCANDSYTSLPFVDRVEQELNAAIDQVSATTSAFDRSTPIEPVSVELPAPKTTDDVLFDQPGDGAGQTEVSFGDSDLVTDVVTENPPVAVVRETESIAAIRVDPIKRLVVNQSWTKDSAFQWDRLLIGLLGTGSVCSIGAACFVDRRRRSARERMVGMSGGMINGLWTGVIGLSALPGAFLGAAFGTLAVNMLGRLSFRNSVPQYGNAIDIQTVFPSGFALAIASCSVVAFLLSHFTQRIPLVHAVRGAPLMTSRRWLRPAALLFVVAALIGWRSRMVGWEAQLVVLIAGFAIAVLLWSLVRSKRLVALWGGVISVIGLVLLRRSWHQGGSGASLVLVVLALVVIVGGLVGSYVATAPGQHFARFGVPRADALALSALRTRVATRPGPWPLLPLVGAILAMSATSTAAAIVLDNANACVLLPGQRDAVVMQEFVPGTVSSLLSAADNKSERLVSMQINRFMMSLPSSDPLTPEPLRRRAAVAVSLPSDVTERTAIIGTRGAASYSSSDSEGVVVVAESARRVFGSVPAVGTTVTVRDSNGTPSALIVRSVIERAPASAAIILNETKLGAMAQGRSVYPLTLAFPKSGSSVGSLRTQLSRAVVGRNVDIREAFTRVRPLNDVERFGGLARNIVILLNLLSAALLVWRWADERRRLLSQTHTAAIGPSYLARSINQDATAHVGVASLLGGVVGLLIGWALLPTVGSMRFPLLTLIATVLLPTLVAAIVARFPSGDGNAQSHQAQ